MVWIFHRDNEVTRIETRFDNDTATYVLHVIRTGGAESTERFTDQAAFDTRVQALERELAEARWILQGGPQVLPDGWRL